MKAGIHPNYVEATVTCACGNTFTTRSTKPQLRTDLCGVCHPFYTGEQRIVDSAAQVERFMRRMEAATSTSARPSKRQLRLNARAEERRKADEQAAAIEAERRERARERARAAAAQQADQGLETAVAAVDTEVVEATVAAEVAETTAAPEPATAPADAAPATPAEPAAATENGQA